MLEKDVDHVQLSTALLDCLKPSFEPTADDN